MAVDLRLRAPFCATLLLLAGLPCLAQQVSLGDLARQQRALHPSTPARVITNDDLLGPAPLATPPAAATATADATSKAAAKPAPAGGPVEAFKAKESAFRTRYAEQQRELESAQRRLTVAEHEYDYQTTLYWMDAGTRLRENNTWAEKRASYEKQIDEDRKQVADAQEKLNAIKEEARRAGLSESSLER